jgi:hypothetical protein
MTSYWHPFAGHGSCRVGELPIVRGEGAYVLTLMGSGTSTLRRFGTATSVTVAEIAEAAAPAARSPPAVQLRRPDSPAAANFAERVAAFAPVPGSKVSAAAVPTRSTGGEARPTLLHELEGPRRLLIVSRRRATSTASHQHRRHPAESGRIWSAHEARRAGPPPHSPTPSTGSRGRVAAFFCEPVVGAAASSRRLLATSRTSRDLP